MQPVVKQREQIYYCEKKKIIKNMGEEKRPNISVAAASLFSGSIAGMAGVATCFPLETIRVRLQTQMNHTEFNGVFDCFVKTMKGEGLRGFYKGMSSPLVGATITKTVNFGTYGYFLSAFREKGKFWDSFVKSER